MNCIYYYLIPKDKYCREHLQYSDNSHHIIKNRVLNLSAIEVIKKVNLVNHIKQLTFSNNQNDVVLNNTINKL